MELQSQCNNDRGCANHLYEVVEARLEATNESQNTYKNSTGIENLTEKSCSAISHSQKWADNWSEWMVYKINRIFFVFIADRGTGKGGWVCSLYLRHNTYCVRVGRGGIRAVIVNAQAPLASSICKTFEYRNIMRKIYFMENPFWKKGMIDYSFRSEKLYEKCTLFHLARYVPSLHSGSTQLPSVDIKYLFADNCVGNPYVETTYWM